MMSELFLFAEATEKKLRATTQNNQQQHLLGVSVLRARKIKKKVE
jgi:hypothetical protein